MSNLFQESTGVTPVTADGQPVGLVLDKSRGDVLGNELVTNGTFNVDTSGWTAGFNTSLSVVSGSLRLTSIADGAATVTQNINVTIGKTYMISIETKTNVGSGGLYINIDGGGVVFFDVRQIEDHALLFTASSSPIEVEFLAGSSQLAGEYKEVDNISVKEVLGIPARQPVSTQRPTYNANPDRLTLDLVDDSLLVTIPTGGWDGYMTIGTDQGTASYGVSLPAGDYALGGDYFMGNTLNQVLFREGDVDPIRLRAVEQKFVDDGAKASYGDVTDFGNYWRAKGITEFPLIDTSSGTNFANAWNGNNLTSFPLIDTSNGTNFSFAWWNNNLTSFPALDFSSATSFYATWRFNTNLADFPANMFDNCSATNFALAFTFANLTQSSIDGILVSIESNGTSNGTFDQSGGSAPSSVGETAIDALRSRGWTITVTGGY